MRRSLPVWLPFSFALVAFGLLCLTQDAAAQRGPGPQTGAQFGIGYVVNAPDQMAGGNAYVIFPKFGGIGVYVDAKFDVTGPTNERGYDPSVTSAEVEGLPDSRYHTTEGSWTSFNVGIVRPLNPQFFLYAGGGVAKLTRYDLFDVNIDGDIGLGGVAWVENPATAETRTNVMGGIMMRMSPHLTAQFGYETQPKGFTAGFSLRLPTW